jgi:hypothetical protein
MFGILGIGVALFMFGTSALANIYKARKYRKNPEVEIKFPHEIVEVGVVSAVVDVIVVALLIFF